MLARKKPRQLIWIDRFDQVVIESRLERAASVTILPPSGESNQPDIGCPRLSPQRLSDLITAQVRHADVEQRSIGAKHLREGKSGSAKMGDPNFVPCHLEQHRKAIRRVPIVIGDEYPPVVRAAPARDQSRDATLLAVAQPAASAR